MIKLKIVLLIFLSFCVGSAVAQFKSSSITGTVSDEKGAVLPGANVSITETNTHVSTTVKTNAAGQYTAPYLEPGSYEVKVQAPGFGTFEKTGIAITTGTAVRVDVHLTVGSVSQTVEVKSSTAELQTESSTVQGEVGASIIKNIPNINDNPIYYATLQAGVVPSSEMYNNEALGVGYSDRQAMSGMNINGGEAGNGDVQVDGISVQGAGWHESTQLPNRDALQEVAVTTNTLPSDLGGGLGVIQLITKSGTNQFHGDLAYRMRNEAFNANSISNNVQGIPKGKYRLNEESGAIGGPVIIPHLFNGRDKVFFFASFSHVNHPSTSAGYYTVPTALERIGDYSASFMRDQNGNPIPAQMYNPYTAVPYQGSKQVFQRTEYPKGPNGAGDFIPNPDPASLAIMGAFPLPNHTPINAFNDNNFYYSGVSTVIRDNLSTRLDVHLSPRNSLYATGGVQLGNAGIVNPFAAGVPAQSGYSPQIVGEPANGSTVFSDANPYVAIGDTITINPTTIIDVRYGINRVHASASKPDPGPQFTAADYTKWGMPASIQQYIAVPGVAPSIGWTGGAPWVGGDTGLENWDVWQRKNEHQTNHTVSASVTKLLGKWNIKAGGEYRVYLSNWADLTDGTPRYSAGDCNCEKFGGVSGGGVGLDNTPQLSGDVAAATSIGAQGWFLLSGSNSKPALAAKYVAFYSQNDWKVTPKLTLNLGLRYEVQPGPTERHNGIGDLDLNATNPYTAQGISASNLSTNAGQGLFVFAGQPGYSRNLWNTEWNNISPRIGAAYSLNEATVLRGGYARVYTPSNTGFNANNTVYGTSGFAGGTNPTPYGLVPNGLPAGTGLGDPRMTQILPALGRVQAPGIYGGTGDPGLFTRDHRNSFMEEWNVTVERRLRGWITSAGYVGSKGSRLTWRDYPLNGESNIPWSTLQSWQSTWQATNGQTDPAQVQIPNPLPGLIGGAQGAIGSGTISVMDSMKPYLAWLGGYIVGDTATSMYHSLQIKAQHSSSNGLTALFTYTYSRTTGLTGGQTAGNGSGSTFAESQLGSSAAGLGGGDYRNLSNNRSLLNFDTPHRFVGVVSYLLPTGRGRRFDPGNPVARALIGEWNISTVVTLQSGEPWGPNCGSENGRCIPTGQPLKLPKSYQHWYDGKTPVTLPDGRTFTPAQNTKLMWNPDAFTGQIVQWADGTYHQAQYWIGTTPQAMSQLRMPSFQNANLAVSRKFPVREEMNFEIFAEVTNAFNHTNYQPADLNNNFGSLVTVPNSSANSKVGQNTSTSVGGLGLSILDSRQMTLSARFNF